MKKRVGVSKKSKKKIIIISVIATVAVIAIGILVFFLFFRRGSMFSFYGMPDFSAGSKVYDSIAKVVGNTFEGTKLNPFENVTG